MRQNPSLCRMTDIVFLAAALLVATVWHLNDNAVAAYRPRTQELAFASRAQKQSEILKELTVQQRDTNKGMTTLQFVASAHYSTTTPVPKSDQMESFLFREHCRDMILAGANHNPVQLCREPGVELYHAWQVEAVKNNVAEPKVGDPILRVTTTGIQFPGLSLVTVATVGCKQVTTPTGPELQITLITDELRAMGPKPMVWIFEHLTGSGSQQQQSPPFSVFVKPNRASNAQRERKTHSTNRIIAEFTQDGVVFRSEVQLVVNVSFPSVLLKMLPLSKSTTEKQVSAAIKKVVERDLKPAMESLSVEYLQWLKENVEKTDA